MKRTISVILCVAMMLSMLGAMIFPAAAEEYSVYDIQEIRFDDFEVVEYTGGSWETTYEWDPGLEEYVDIEYYQYYPTPTYGTVVLTGGSEITDTVSNLTDLFGTWLCTSLPETKDWTLGGSYEMEAYFDGNESVTGKATVTIVASPVKSLTVEPIELIENEDGDTWEYEDKEYYRYNYSQYIKATVEFKDGTTFTGSTFELEDKYGSYVEYTDDQSVDAPWGVGSHEVEFEFMGCAAKGTVKVIKSPVKSITVKPITVIEKVDGYYTYDDEEYFNYSITPNEVTVELNDGTKLTGEPYKIQRKLESKYPDRWYNCYCDQSASNEWGVGKHTSTFVYLGFRAEYTVNVVASPVKSVVIDPVSLYYGVDGYYIDGQFHYSLVSIPLSCTVTLNDGTVLKPDDYGNLTWNGNWYYCDLEEYTVKAAADKTASVKANVMGKDATLSVKPLSFDYTSAEVSGKDEMKFTLTKSDGSKDVFNVKSFNNFGFDYGESGKNYHVLVTDKHTFNCVNVTYSDDVPYQSDLQLEFGSLKSAKTSDCSWLRAEHILYFMGNKLLLLGSTNEKVGALNGSITAANVDELVSIVFSNYDVEDCEYDFNSGKEIATGTAANVKKAIKQLSGLDVDVTKSSFYNSENGTLTVEYYENMPAESSSSTVNYSYEKGVWTLKGTIPGLKLTATFDDKVQLKTVSFNRIDAIEFKDVKKDAYYEEAVAWAISLDITNGTGKDTFSPNNKCTRGQVVTFLWRAAGEPKAKSSNNPFTDVKAGAFYYDAVLWAVENEVTSGLSATTFGPGKECTRGQVVTFLWRAQGKPVPGTTTHPFTDVKKDAFYYDAMLWAVDNDITNGTTATTFGPGKTCTRGQVVTFLYRTYN